MRGPIDYIIVGFEGNKFNGTILGALGDAIDKGIIALVALVLISKDEAGKVTTIDIDGSDDKYAIEFADTYQPTDSDILDQDDIDEMADLLENNTSAGLLVVEQLWAKPLKKALQDAGGVLVADGRIHPDAEAELNEEGGP